MKQSLEWKSNWIKIKEWFSAKTESKTRKPNYKVRYIVQRSITYILLTFAALLVFMPFYWMVLTALKSDYAVEIRPPQLFTLKLHFENFLRAWQATRFDLYFRNTLIVAFFSTLGTVVTSTLAAFAFARLEFKGRDVLFLILLGTMMVPGEMLIITNFITVKSLNWDDTFFALIVPFMTSVFYIFFLRQTFKQIPNELYLAAKVDGTSDFKYLLKVMIPIAKPTLTTIIILSAIGSWNAYVWPSLVTSLSNDARKMISNGLRDSAFVDDLGRIRYNLQMAGSTIVTLPLLIVFLTLKKYIIRGVSRSGIKG
ncbi:MAG TPA: carbohydrate ABC transporter permease [Haloplasmataceae bacterium]